MMEKLGRVLVAAFLLIYLIQPEIVQGRNPRRSVAENQNENNSTNITKEAEKEVQKPVPEELKCLEKFEIRPNNSACLVPISKSFKDAIDYCMAHNLTLVEVQSGSEKKELVRVAKKFFGYGGGTTIWIDGMWSYDVKKYLKYKTNETFSLSTTVEDPHKRFVGQDEYCLNVQSFYLSQYEIAPIRCYYECYFFCEKNGLFEVPKEVSDETSEKVSDEVTEKDPDEVTETASSKIDNEDNDDVS